MMKHCIKSLNSLIPVLILLCLTAIITFNLKPATADAAGFSCVEYTTVNTEHEDAGRAEVYTASTGCESYRRYRAVGSSDELGAADVTTTLAEYPAGSYSNRTCAVCGDNIVEMSEACDDGNTRNGDGCDSDCKLECTPVAFDDATCDGIDDDCDGITDEDGACSIGSVDCTLNPYAAADWSAWNQFKANFHTHTTESDGSQSPAAVIDEYHAADYAILAITDHNTITWPWSDYGRNPDSLGMLAVRGNEFSSSDHINAFFDFTTSSNSLESGIPHVAARGGLAHINHPGRYNTPADWDWYVPWFMAYPSCVGMEVFNQGDRYPTDRQLWDNINERFFPATGRMVWGYSNDDKHTTNHLYRNFQFMVMPELTEDALRKSQQDGAFYFCYEPGGSGDADVPRINEITVDNVSKTISIAASGYERIYWIGPGTAVVATGPIFDFSAYLDIPFARAVLDGGSGDCYTQPFGFHTTK